MRFDPSSRMAADYWVCPLCKERTVGVANQEGGTSTIMHENLNFRAITCWSFHEGRGFFMLMDFWNL